MDLLRIGTLGSSRISEAALIDPAASVPEVTVAAVAARDKSRADAFALRHGIPAAYGSYEDLLADPDIDAVYNPLPNSLHGPWTLRAIAAGKHVLCEKPFASNADEAARVADAAAASGLVVMEAMHYRYHPLTRRLSELVAELGPVQHLQCWTSFAIKDPDDIRYDFDLGGGALMDGGCYAIDCLRLLGAGEGQEPAHGDRGAGRPVPACPRPAPGGGGGPLDGRPAGLPRRGDRLVRVLVHHGRRVPGRRARDLRRRAGAAGELHLRRTGAGWWRRGTDPWWPTSRAAATRPTSASFARSPPRSPQAQGLTRCRHRRRTPW